VNLCVVSIGDTRCETLAQVFTRVFAGPLIMDHRALQSSAPAREVLPVSPASLIDTVPTIVFERRLCLSSCPLPTKPTRRLKISQDADGS
jgi:hypothetical protein